MITVCLIFHDIVCFLLSHILHDSDKKVAALLESEMVIVVRGQSSAAAPFVLEHSIGL